MTEGQSEWMSFSQCESGRNQKGVEQKGRRKVKKQAGRQNLAADQRGKDTEAAAGI